MNKQVIVYSVQGCNECNKEVEKFGFIVVPVTVVADQAVKGFNPAELKN
ncbi:thioredoxin domain-containing protein [Thermaerobacillus caldiproteolyticus]|uniref:Glutaredoxin-like protein NrdH n=1 Tax=Thermaerobacillus caldiproteolyticus TaxID=247480 RepID=A0A7V9Z5M0_9BACL|nr:hypothetical protein [Anoxybacillus caldiproteolyticus]MBA2874365.1 glutaredoxin-like protein NrdH [Anoxybacillus caldiproteolyticus]